MKKLGIICAMEEELAPIVQNMNVKDKITKAKMNFFSGEIYGVEIVAVRCGIAKVNAAICAQIMIDNFDVTHIMNIGIAGGTIDSVHPLDIVVASDLVQHDLDATAFDDPVGQVPQLDTFSFVCDETLIDIARKAALAIPDIKVHEGRIVSGDQFIASKEKLQYLHDTFKSHATEMEGAAVAHACYLNSIPFIVIRSISDNAIIGEYIDYLKFKEQATIHSFKLLKEFLKLYKEI